jgi:hypothetical protein
MPLISEELHSIAHFLGSPGGIVVRKSDDSEL